MELGRILDIVARKVQDESYGEADYIDFINLGLGEIISTEKLPHLTTRDSIIVQAGSFEADIPDDLYQGPLLAYSVTRKQPVKVFRNFTEFELKHPHFGESGPVVRICNLGEHMIVQDTPTEDEEIRLYYHRKFEFVRNRNDNSRLAWIPYHLRGSLLINYCCMQAFSEIEDGETGKMPNYMKYTDLYYKARAELRGFLKAPDEPPDFIEDTWTEKVDV